MSKLKSPQDKKAISLSRDRRNNYGENDKASRKNIPRSKQISHQAERRAAKQPLSELKGSIDEQVAESGELQSANESIRQERNSFRKRPDVPLGKVLEHKHTGV